ncbi:MAG: hypothetical protein ACPGSM_15920, partial [Thiolinea sp.]
VWGIEKGKTKSPDLEILFRAAEICDVSAAWLICGESELDDLSKESLELAKIYNSFPKEIQEVIKKIIFSFELNKNI